MDALSNQLWAWSLDVGQGQLLAQIDDSVRLF
jgi:hypothetical protein